MKKKHKILIIVTIIVMVIVALIYESSSRDFSGKININKLNIVDKIEDSQQINVLGNYIFLMSPGPTDSDKDKWYDENSYLIVTDQNLKMKEAIKLDGYYEEISLRDKNLSLFTRDNPNYDYYDQIKNPKIITSVFADGQYTKFKEERKEDFDMPKMPRVAIGEIIDENKYISLKEPVFESGKYFYQVVDFTQNINNYIKNTDY